MATSSEHELFITQITAHPEIKLSLKEILAELEKIIPFLEASQYALIEMLINNNIWTGPPPVKPTATDGDLEFGLVPRWIHYPPDFIDDYLKKHPILNDIWKGMGFLIPNAIDDTNYNALIVAVEKEGIIADDGTYYGLGKYEQLDPGWTWSLVDYLYVVFMVDYAPFPIKAPTPIQLSGKNPDQVTIAMLGDWGTGPFENGSPTEITDQITAMKPDYIVHLGDVYYSGTNGYFMPPNEEQQNLINCWPASQKPGTSFTMNSNHEMYSGAKGLFEIALQKSGTPFSAQNQNSYFVLQYAGWTLLGLDSGYFSTSPLFMVGSMAGDKNPQPGWIQQLKLSPEKVIVLSHHNGLTYDGKNEPRYPNDSPSSFWDEVNEVLGGDPAAWYWGHIHNGIVYKTPTVTGRKTLARCLGHASLPFGNAWGIQNDPQFVDFYTHTPNPAAGPLRVKNGFVLLTITSDGRVTEEFFDQGNQKVTHTHSYA